ncbi:MAG: dephospho-CoA kinase [Oscillospiraceae bacterium]|nr:dephospho-CoA kinase [Oscillospiraceae bacterium]
MSLRNLDRRKELAATACLLLTSLIWGFAFVAQLKGTETMGAFTFNAMRSIIAALVLLPVALILEKGKSGEKETRDTIIAAILGGGVLFVASNLQQYGIIWTQSPARAGFITGLYMIFTPLAGLFFKRKTTVYTAIGAVIALGGLYLLSVGKDGENSAKGVIALFVGAFFWTAHILIIDHFAKKIRPVRYSLAQFLVCAVLCIAAALFTDTITIAGIWSGALPLLYTGVLSSGVAYTLQFVGQRHVEPARASVLFSMETVFSALGEVLLLGQFLDGLGYLGCAMIFAGILLAQFRSANPERNETKISTKLYGVIGPTGAGKSTLCRALEARGFFVIDGDELARRVTAPGSPVLDALTQAFGQDILEKGVMNRKELARQAFSSPEKTAKLNAIIHPAIEDLMYSDISAAQAKTVFIEGAALLESPIKCAAYIAVLAPEEMRLERIMRRDGISEQEARLRMSAQRDDKYYSSTAAYTVDGAGDIAEQIEDLLGQIMQ